MGRCEDYPCCGHAEGECPIDAEGRPVCLDCGRPIRKGKLCKRCRRERVARTRGA